MDQITVDQITYKVDNKPGYDSILEQVADICKNHPGYHEDCYCCPFYIPDDDPDEEVVIWYCAFSGSPDTWEIDRIKEVINGSDKNGI